MKGSRRKSGRLRARRQHKASECAFGASQDQRQYGHLGFQSDDSDWMFPHARPAIGLYLFQTDPTAAASAREHGVDKIIFDVEKKGKRTRQASFNTSITGASIDELSEFVAISGITPICRLDAWDDASPRQIDIAIEAGVETLVLPMARTLSEVDSFIRAVAGRCKIGLMLETTELLQSLPEIWHRQPDLAYVGLQDLMIARRGRSLFQPLCDGTIERIRESLPGISLGVAGATHPQFGAPIPFPLLAAEMSRLGIDFTFLRRSFLADVPGDQIRPAVAAIRKLWEELSRRDEEAVLHDQHRFRQGVADIGRRKGRGSCQALTVGQTLT